MKRYLIISACILISSHLFSSRLFNEQDCMVQLRELYKELSENIKPSRDKVIYLCYAVTTKLNERFGGVQHTSEIEVYANKEKSYLISKEIEVYQDQQYSVSIIPDNKTIYISDYTGNEMKSHKIEQLTFLQDTLFTMAEVIQCERINENERTYKKIILELNESAREMFKALYFTFLIDVDKSFIKKISTDFIPTHKIANMEVTIVQFDNDFKTDILTKPILSMIIQADGNLLPAYQGYTLVDTRIKEE